MRNPWGKKEWQGDWSDSSSKWTPKTKAQVDYTDAEDGTFFIAFKDFYKFFFITTVCYQNLKKEPISKHVADTHDEYGFGGVCKVTVGEDQREPVSFMLD